MVKENVELTERVKELMSDYNKVVKQLQTTPSLSDLTEALDKVEMSDATAISLKRNANIGKGFMRRYSTCMTGKARN